MENLLSKEPFVATYDSIVTEEECEHFIKISKNLLTRALVSDNKKGYVSKGRTGCGGMDASTRKSQYSPAYLLSFDLATKKR